MIDTKTTHAWAVRMTLPKTDGRRWTENKSVTCLCDTLEEAVSLARGMHPDATIYSVNHRGEDSLYWKTADGFQLPEALVK